MTRTITVDFDAVHCNPAHLTATGHGWGVRLRELGATSEEIQLLVQRLKTGKAAEIELGRIKDIAGVR